MARRKRTSTAEDFIELVSLLPWWVGVGLALVSFLFLHAWSAGLSAPGVPPMLMLAPLIHAAQYAVPFFCLIGAAVSAYRRHQRKTLATNVALGQTANVLDGMGWREFEMLVGEGFRLRGYQVSETGGAGPDGGIDLVLRKRGEDKVLVQCKQWRTFKVGVAVVRELYGAMAAEGAAGGIVVTSGRFTPDARAFAQGRNIELMDGEALFKMIRTVRAQAGTATQRDAPTARPVSSSPSPGPTPERPVAAHPSSTATPACPRCAGQMVRRTAKKGANAGESFWGCAAFPKCRGTA